MIAIQYKAVEVITSAGANPNPQNQFGTTPLLSLTRTKKGSLQGRIKAAKVVLEAGADVKIPDGDGRLAWELAAEEEGAEELLRILSPLD